MDVIVFGIRNYYEFKKKSIQDKYNVIAYLDSSIKPGECGEYSDGNAIFNPKEVGALPEVPIVLMSVKFVSMYLCLMECGIDAERVIFGANILPAYNPFEELLNEHEGKIKSTNGNLTLEWDEEKYVCRTQEDLESVTHKLFRVERPEIELISNLPRNPISRRFGGEFGKPIDRWYIEQFLRENIDKIHGCVAEFADDRYTKYFGKNIERSYIMHVDGWGENVIKANLVTGEGIIDELLDCMICTQTIQFIFDIDAAVKNIVRSLKRGGYALITAHGISQISLYDYRNWGEYWRFTPMALEKLFRKNCDNVEVNIRAYGNVKAAMAMLYGLCADDLSIEDFDYNDEQFPVIIAISVKKK